MKIQLTSPQCIPPWPAASEDRVQLATGTSAAERERESEGLRWCGKRASGRAHSFLPPPSLPFRWRPRSRAAFAFGNLRRRSRRPRTCSSQLGGLGPSPQQREWRRADTERQRGRSVCPTEDGRAGATPGTPTTSLSGASPALLPARQGPRPVSPKRGRGRKRLHLAAGLSSSF